MDEQWQVLSRKSSPTFWHQLQTLFRRWKILLVISRHDVGFKHRWGNLAHFPGAENTSKMCAGIEPSPSGLCPHGNLHPNNVFWDGQQVLFMDPLTPLLRLHHADLLKAKGLTAFTPPEYRSIRTRKSSWSPSVATDTHGLALLMGRLVRDCEWKSVHKV